MVGLAAAAGAAAAAPPPMASATMSCSFFLRASSMPEQNFSRMAVLPNYMAPGQGMACVTLGTCLE